MILMPSLLNPLLRPLRHELQRLHHPTRFRELKRLLQSQQLSREALQQQQQQLLQQIVQHAVIHSPYYSNRFSGIEWHHQLERLPILQKEAVREQGRSMVDRSASPDTLRQGFTGGSTGTPLGYYYNAEKIELLRAGQYRSFMQCGWQPGERVLQRWGAAQDLQQRITLKQRWLNWIGAEQTIAAFEFDEAQLQCWYQQICSYRPVVIRGYPSILAALADYLLKQQLTLPDSIKGCFCTAEVLYPQQRTRIEAALRCKLYNQYGSREIPNISCECSHGRQHVFTDLVALESVKIDGADQLLVTSLTNRLMPMIRYQIGDHGRLLKEPCSCGSPFPLMEMDVCRSNDLLQTPNGQRIYPSWLIHLLDGVKGIQQYQFRQRALDRITLYLVAEQIDLQTLQQQLEPQLQQKMGATMQLQIEWVAKIERGSSGKHRFVCCDLD